MSTDECPHCVALRAELALVRSMLLLRNCDLEVVPAHAPIETIRVRAGELSTEQLIGLRKRTALLQRDMRALRADARSLRDTIPATIDWLSTSIGAALVAENQRRASLEHRVSKLAALF